MLKINNLSAKIDNKSILQDFKLEINPGEVHAIMGPNGSGKSTLSNILSGKKGYDVSGEVLFENKNLFDLETEERAHKGIFLAFGIWIIKKRKPRQDSCDDNNNLNYLRKVRVQEDYCKPNGENLKKSFKLPQKINFGFIFFICL